MQLFFKLKNYLPLIVLFLIEVLLFVFNYQHGTYFLGWDNLAPEFNVSENIKRSIFAIWEEYRGLGLLDGMSFAANLPHYLFIGLLSLILPHDLLRYFFIFLMHFLGGVGMYLLIGELLQEQKYKKIAAFFGGLFYLFNIATVQMFFIPYEVFAVHFAFLPILLLLVIKYLKSGSKKHFLWLSVLTLCSIPQAHVPTLFIVYSFALFALLAFYSLQTGKVGLKRSLIVIALTIIFNAFWAFPYAYSTLQNANIISNSKINQMGTEDIFRRNQAFGDLFDVVLMKGFALDFLDIKTPGTSGYMMEQWRNYTASPLFIIIGIFFFLTACFGLIRAIVTKEKQMYPFILLFVFSFLMLGTTIPVLSIVSAFFYTYIPYFFQIFRFTFTKFSILYAFSFSVLFSFGILYFFQFFGKFKYFKSTLIVILVGIFVYYSYPSFTGQFIYPNLKNSVPQDYFALINYFKKEDHNTRIALLPQPSYWGWTYNQWGYRGSGFIWYGLPQASLDGAFYPWSKQNENYYWEITYAIYSGNVELLDQVLEKYQVNWAVVDHSIITQLAPKSLYLENLEALMKQSKKAHLVKSFGKINVYQVSSHGTKTFVSLANHLPEIAPLYQANNVDQAYADIGMYRSDIAQAGKVVSENYYPFRSLFTGKTQKEHEFTVTETDNEYSFAFKIPETFVNATLLVPPINSQVIQEIDPNNTAPAGAKMPEIQTGTGSLYPNIYTGVTFPAEATLSYNVKAGETIKITLPKVNGYLSYDSKKADDLFSRKAYRCINTQGESSFKTLQENNEKIIQLEARDTDLCYDIYLPNLSQRLSYLISVSSRSKSGRPLIFWLENQNSRRSDIETYLSSSKDFKTNYFIQPPMEYYGLGYTIHLQNHAVGRERTINEVKRVDVHPFPYTFLTGMKVVDGQLQKTSSIYYSRFSVEHSNPSIYYVHINSEKDSPETLILSQSYHPAWKAYVVDSKNIFTGLFPFIGNKELKNHFMVNNWQNGWELDLQDQKESTILLVFWPQWLEYLGFWLLPLPFIYALWPRKKKKENREEEMLSKEENGL